MEIETMGRNTGTIAMAPDGVWRAHAASVSGVIAFGALTVLAAYVRVPLPFTPVPMTLQLLPVLLAGAFLGPARGAASQVLLIATGAAGAPVFAGGAFGPAHLIGPTGGYLIGFAVAAWLVGLIVRRFRPGPAGIFAAMIGGAAAVHLLGVLRLALFLDGSPTLAFQLGSAPFLAGDVVKVLAAASTAAAWRARSSRRSMVERDA